MAYKCQNCGGNLYYNISGKDLKCESCDSVFPLGELPVPEFGDNVRIAQDHMKAVELKKNETAEEHVHFDYQVGMPVVSFVCKNCGAELLSPDESIISYCSYCGSEAMLEGRLTEEVKPKYILPFQQTKTQCKNIYKNRTEKMFFLPKELKDPKYLERFRGTYIPYWMYKVDFPDDITLEAKKTSQSGKMITESTYEIDATVDGSYEGVPYDASSCFDDTISDMLMPFDKKKLQEFHPGYLAGFYADRADVPSEKYYSDAEGRAIVNAFEDVSRSVRKNHLMNVDSLKDKDKKNLFHPEIQDSFTSLFPIWFLTWRNKKRVAYAIVNGQNGRISCDLPVDMKKFGLSTLGTAALIFLLLTLFVSMTAKTALMICSIITTVALGFFRIEAREIRDRENHIFDKGYFVKGREVKMKEKKREKIRNKKKAVDKNKGTILTAMGVLLLIAFIFNTNELSAYDKLLVVTSICFVIGTAFAIMGRSALRYVREKSIRLFNFVAWAALVGAFVIAAWNPVDDIYYYFGCLGCGLGAALGSFGLINYYNLLTTRPIPTFFDREGGRDNEKE